MTDLIVKAFEGHDIRIHDDKGRPWFVAKDVCDALGIKNVAQAIGRLDDDERYMFNIGRQGDTWIVNEYGLYSLVIGSRKPEAKAFKRWITHDVLPTIRKTGRYDIRDDYQFVRTESKKVRLQFTDTLKLFGCSAPIQYIKITATMKKNAGIPGNRKKDDMDVIELAKVSAYESLGRLQLMLEQPRGFDEVKQVCQQSSRAIAAAAQVRRVTA